MLEIALLGRFELCLDGEPVELASRPQQKLLVYLALHAGRSVPRVKLAGLLWPDSPEDTGRKNLRHYLWRLHQAIGDGYLLTARNAVAFDANSEYRLDVERLERPYVESDIDGLIKAVTAYNGELLPGFYDDWIQQERERLTTVFERQMQTLLDGLIVADRWSEVAAWSEHWIAIGPAPERAYRLLMIGHAGQGDVASVTRTFQRCEEELEEAYGVKPSDETRALLQWLTQRGRPFDDGDQLRQYLTQPTASLFGRKLKPRISPALVLVDRSREWARLQALANRAWQGGAQFVCILGEAGIGKTRLAEELFSWAQEGGVISARTRSYDAQGSLAYSAVARLLLQYELSKRLERLSDTWLTEIGRLVPEFIEGRPDLQPPGPLTEGWQKRRFFEALARGILVDDSPVLLVFDDLQWLDQESLEWLHYLLRFDPGSSLLLVGTCRDDEVEPDHPLTKLRRDLLRDDQLSDILLSPLNKEHSGSLAEEVSGSRLGREERESLFTDTEGNPLFIVETMRARLVDEDADMLAKTADSTGSVRPIGTAAVPPKIEALIQGRLGRVSQDARELMNIAATIGRSFDYQVLLAANPMPERRLTEILDELWVKRIIRAGEINEYDFSHDKIREVAAAQISRPQKRSLNERIAQALEKVFAGRLDDVAGEMAVHFEEAGSFEKAVAYYQQAASVEQKIGAYHNMVFYLARGIECLGRLPRTQETIKQELTMQLSLGYALIQTRGAADLDVESAFARAEMLCKRIGQDPELFRALYGLMQYQMMRADLPKMLDLSWQCLEIAKQTKDAVQMMVGHLSVGVTNYFMGDFVEAKDHLEQICDRYYDLSAHKSLALVLGQDPCVTGDAYLGLTLWFLGYPDRALKRLEAASSLAEKLAHQYTSITAQFYLTIFYTFRYEPALAKTHAQEYVDGSAKYELELGLLQGQLFTEWAKAVLNPNEKSALRDLKGWVKAYLEHGNELSYPAALNLLAQVCIQAGRSDEAPAILSEALAYVEKNGDRYNLAETHRLQGEALMPVDQKGAEAAFLRGISVSEEQHAKSMQLRCTISLCRFWIRQGREEEAKKRLSKIYGWFEEGFETPDLIEARTLLEELKS